MSQRIALAIFLLLLFMPFTKAIAQPSPPLMQKATDPAGLLASADEKGGVRVIVEFESDVSEKDIQPNREVLDRVKSGIRRKQDIIIARHFGDANRPTPPQTFQRDLKRGSISPFFVINVTKSELEVLAADPDVIRINRDTADRVNLVHTIPFVEMSHPDGGAYAKGATGAGQVVAILDTGVQADHPFIAGKIIAEACFSTTSSVENSQSLCRNGAPMDTDPGAGAPCSGFDACVHGTHVAGIAAGNNTTPGVPVGSPPNGIAKDAKLVSIKIFSIYNSPQSCGFGNPTPCILSNRSDQIAALDWLYENSQLSHAKIASANISVGGGLYYGNCDNDKDIRAIKESIVRLRSVNIATVIAAGNDSATGAIAAPACVSSAIRVSSSTKNDKVSDFSNIATMTDLLAPGGNLSGAAQDIISSVPGNQYAYYAGTSMAAPHVAGAFAALRTQYPLASVQTILDALTNTGRRITDDRKNGSITKPRIQVAHAVAALGPPVLKVDSSVGQNVFGIGPGVFFPATFEYELTSTGPLNFTVAISVPWITAWPPSGALDPLSPTKVRFTVLSGGSSGATATITFKNDTTGQGTTSRTVSLKIFTIDEQRFHGLSPLSGLQNSSAAGVAPDGSSVVGTSCQPGEIQCQAMYWTLGFPVSAGRAPGYSYTRGVGVSVRGGNLIGLAIKDVGRDTRLNCAGSESSAIQQGVLRANHGLLYALGCLPGHNWSQANAISYDGSTIVGDSANIHVIGSHRAMRWVRGTPYQLPTLIEGAGETYAYGVNSNGSVIVGSDFGQAVIWNIAPSNVATIRPLGFIHPGDSISIARAVSANGNVVVGYGRKSSKVGNNIAFRWADGVMLALGKLPGTAESTAHAVSGDGNVVVGTSGVPFRWTPAGIRSIPDLAAAAGFDLSLWRLTNATGVSEDGTMIVGSGFYDPTGTGINWVQRAWVLKLHH
jgi:subtilisin